MLNLPVFSDADPRGAAAICRRDASGFEEVLAGLTEAEARHEAQRCLSCGNCFECDNCFAACPEDAIIKLGPGQGYSVDPETAPAAPSASSNVPATPSRWSPKIADP